MGSRKARSALHLEAGYGWVGSDNYLAFDRTFSAGRIDDALFEESGLTVEDADPAGNLRIRSVRFDVFLVSQVITTRSITINWHRDRVLARQRYAALFVDYGQLEQEMVGQGVTSAGLSIIQPGSGPVTVKLLGPARLLCFSFHRGEVEPLGFDPSLATAHRPTSLVYQVTYTYLLGLIHAALQNTDGDPDVIRYLTQSVARALVQEALVPAVSSRDTTVERARKLIAERYQQASFNSQEIAVALGISPRALQRAFAVRGALVSDEIRHARAAQAMRLINDEAQKTTKAVAVESGFQSVVTMRRALQTYYQASPTSIRRALHDHGS